MSSYGITDHQTGLSIVSQNIGAIGRIANYQINNRKKFMGPFRRYKTNMERRALALITQTIPSLATINHQSDSHDGVRGEGWQGWQGWLPTYFKFNFLLRA